ncbi:MAG TPA: AAA family ATPase [Terriglobia bacterium]|nr:AAA family ATPase [Terriglobia bacterium]
MLKRLRTKNFKSLRNLDLSPGLLTVLVGPNMGGKSNVLDVLRFLYESWFPQPGTSGPLNALNQRGGIDEVLWKGSQETLVAIDIEFTDPAQPGRSYEYGIELVGGAGGFVNIQTERLILREDSEQYPLIMHDSSGRWLNNAKSERLVSVHAYGSAMELAPPNWDAYPVKSFVQNWRFYQLVPYLMKQVNAVTAGGVLQPHGDNLSAWLMWLQTRAPESFRRITEVAQDVFPSIRRLLSWPTQQGTVYLTSEEQNLIRTTPLFQMSDGEVVFIALLSLICAPDDLGGTLFCIEEPENYLHPKLLETLVGLLRQTQQEAVDRGVPPSQVLLTTQSPYLVNQMSLDEIIWVDKKDGETRVVRPSDKTHLRQLIEDKALGLGDLMFTGALGD